MKRLLWIIFLYLLLWGYKPNLHACGSDTTRLHSAEKSLSLNLGSGVGYASLLDCGVSPLSYHGAALVPSLQIAAICPQWLWNCTLSLYGAYLEDYLPPSLNFTTLSGGGYLSFEAFFPIKKHNALTYYLGGSLRYIALVDNNSQYMNAATALHAALQPQLCGAVSLSHHRWTFFGSLQLSPLSYSVAPGYAYIDNYSATNNTSLSQYFTHYHHSLQGFTSLSTLLGAKFHLANGNAISLAYHWQYITMQQQYYQALHTLNFNLHFKLK